MPLSDVALCTRALLKIGAAPIHSFEDGTAESEVAAALYDSARDALLSAYPWSFASGQISLPQLSESPLADYAYAYQLPIDFLRALSAGNGGRGKGAHYRITGDTLHCDEDSVILTYIYRPDEASFPPFFETALMARLAAEFCVPLTESSARAEMLYKLAQSEFETAKRIDAQQDTPNAFDDFTLIKVR